MTVHVYGDIMLCKRVTVDYGTYFDVCQIID